MKRFAKVGAAVLALGFVAFAAMSYDVQIKISEKQAAACDPNNPSCGS